MGRQRFNVVFHLSTNRILFITVLKNVVSFAQAHVLHTRDLCTIVLAAALLLKPGSVFFNIYSLFTPLGPRSGAWRALQFGNMG